MAIGLDNPHQQIVLLCIFSYFNASCSFPDSFSVKTVSPVCFWVNATSQQQIVDLHNELRRRVAKGQKWMGDDGPQLAAVNIREFVRKILLSLHQSTDNCINTDCYCKWCSKARISHYILVLQFVNSRRNINKLLRRHSHKETIYESG